MVWDRKGSLWIGLDLARLTANSHLLPKWPADLGLDLVTCFGWQIIGSNDYLRSDRYICRKWFFGTFSWWDTMIHVNIVFRLDSIWFNKIRLSLHKVVLTDHEYHGNTAAIRLAACCYHVHILFLLASKSNHFFCVVTWGILRWRPSIIRFTLADAIDLGNTWKFCGKALCFRYFWH